MNEAALFQRLNALSDATRSRLLHVLERHELTVSELVAVVQLPQSTVSRHLKILADEGWVSARAEGTSRYYRVSRELEPAARRLWDVVREELAQSAEAAQDEGRAVEVLSRRRTRSQEFFATAAGQWDSVRAELFGERPELPALLALLDPDWTVGDLGCGTGQLAATVAPYVRRVVGVDESADMLEAARTRLNDPSGATAASSGGNGASAPDGAPTSNIELRHGRLEALPLDDGSLDVAVLSLVLHYVPQPERAVGEAARVLRPGGRLLVVDMMAHGREEYRERMGHLWQGFTREQVAEWLQGAGLERIRHQPLPPDPEARGPLLFVASATRAAA